MDFLRGLYKNQPTPTVSRETVTTLDVTAYTGLWYDVAHIPQSYQSNCTTSIAVYLRDGPSLRVHNYCYQQGKIVDTATGKATIPDPREPGKLVVEFDGVVFNRKGNYWIHETDYKTYSLVGDGIGEACWIMAREAALPAALLNQLTAKLQAFGYDVERIVYKQPKVR